jgi:hypothetical protein
MAMPSEIPPPFDEEPQPPGWTDADIFGRPALTLVQEIEPLRLMDHVLALTQQMAESVGDQLGDVLRRTKSRNWMLGQLRKRTNGRHSDDEIRDAIAALARQHRPTITDELAHREVELTSRRPLIFLEASSWPAWGPRVEQLGSLVVYPMTMLELTTRAHVRLGWTDNHVKQTTAAAEDANELWYDRAFSHWHRTPERTLMTDPKKKTQVKRTQRHLPVVLKEEDRAALVDRIRASNEEWDALMTELVEFKKAQRAKLEAAEARREQAIKAMTSGRETQLVECEERWDYGQRQVVTLRKDTGEVVDTREMTADELQLRMPEAS